MKTIDVTASADYRVEIGPGALALAGERLKAFCPRAQTAVVVSDDTVFPLHGAKVVYSLREAGFETKTYTVPHGEASKNADSLISLLNFLTECGVTRSDALVALGGGMVGDLTGFAAAVYMRGIDYIQCPTTLLAAVDSSVGGKTAVDLPAGKNLMGAFWQPRCVLCDTDTLDTLPEAVFADGCAEVVKTAILFDPALFSTLYHTGKAFDRETVIARCVEHKRDIVAEDEFDTGRRGLLNLGHTFGHAAEICSKYVLSHGQAVAIGTAVVCRASAKAGFCGDFLPAAVEELLGRFGLPTKTDLPMYRLMPAMLSDKKRSGAAVNVIIPERVGHCSIRPMTAEELRSFMETGL